MSSLRVSRTAAAIRAATRRSSSASHGQISGRRRGGTAVSWVTRRRRRQVIASSSPARRRPNRLLYRPRGERFAVSPGDSRARPRVRPLADRLSGHLLRVSVGHDAFARAGALPDVRRAVDGGAPRLDRRVRAGRAEALRRHRPDPVHDRRSRLRQRGRQAGDPPDEPDPRPLRDLERGLPVRPLVVRLRADSLERAVRLAAVDRDREAARRSSSGGRSAGAWRSGTFPRRTRSSSG